MTAADIAAQQPRALRRSVEQCRLQAHRGAAADSVARRRRRRSGGEKFSADHAPVFVFPNPLNPQEATSSSTAASRSTISRTTTCSRPSCRTGPSSTSRSRATTIAICRCSSPSQGFFDEAWKLQGAASPTDEQVINYWPSLCARPGHRGAVANGGSGPLPAAALRRRQDVDGVRLRDRGVCGARRRSSRRRRRSVRRSRSNRSIDEPLQGRQSVVAPQPRGGPASRSRSTRSSSISSSGRCATAANPTALSTSPSGL